MLLASAGNDEVLGAALAIKPWLDSLPCMDDGELFEESCALPLPPAVGLALLPREDGGGGGAVPAIRTSGSCVSMRRYIFVFVTLSYELAPWTQRRNGNK